VKTAIDAKLLDDRVGEYRMEQGGRLAVAATSGALAFDWAGPLVGGKTRMVPASEATFFAPGVEATFVRDPRGNVIELIVLRNGSAERGRKVR
jgi:hypothetical protein